jgi:outer membrane protein OmpA-like peptidoglycan-associated protein
MRSCVALAGAFVAALLLAPTGAFAQDAGGTALNQLDPAPAGDTFVGVPSPFARGNLVPRGLVMFDYASQPLRLVQPAGDANVVAKQGFLHINASFAVQDRLLISVLLPVALLQGGDDPTVQGVKLTSPSSTQIGDLRIGLRIRMFGDDEDPFQLGVGASLYVPTGEKGSYVGDGSVRGAPYLSAGGRFKLGVPMLWTAAGGALVSSSTNPSHITYGAGLAAMFFDEVLQVGPEFYGSTPIQDGTLNLGQDLKLPQTISTNAELLFSARARFLGGLVIGAAGGPGLGHAVGTPAFRVTGTVGWAPGGHRSGPTAPTDADGDGLIEPADACPYAFGPKSADPKRNGCPVLDDDEDGIANPDDACPAVYGRASKDPKANGCPALPPADADGDGIPDADDACPHELGSPSFDKTKNGCASAPPPPNPDVDGDGVPDTDDACPHEKGARSSDAKATGCPKLVRVMGGEIVLLAPVEFKPGKKTPVADTSDAVLGEVRDVIAQHPDFVRIEVQAHTDNKGTAFINGKISQTQAESVMEWLVSHGVPASKLTAKGYGPERPIADNATAEGRAKNKRVQIVVLEKKP